MRKNRWFTKAAGVLLSAALVLGMAGQAVFAESTTEAAAEEAATGSAVEETAVSGPVNLLLIGQDRREGQGRQRSDTMILLTMDPETNFLGLTSFMRDLYVPIPGNGSSRLNAAYAWGGMELLDQTLEEDFGVSIDGNIEIDFETFISMVDEIGGVDLELTQGEIDFINQHAAPAEGEEENVLQEGMNHLNGSQALAHARNRYIGNDYERTNRQRKILISIFENMRNSNILELTKLMTKMLPYTTTDMTVDELVPYAQMALSMKSAPVQSYRIPMDGAFSSQTISGMMVLVPDLEACRQFLAETLPQ